MKRMSGVAMKILYCRQKEKHLPQCRRGFACNAPVVCADIILFGYSFSMLSDNLVSALLYRPFKINRAHTVRASLLGMNTVYAFDSVRSNDR